MTQKKRIWEYSYKKPFNQYTSVRTKKFDIAQAADYYCYFYDYDSRNWFLTFDGGDESSFCLAFLTDVLRRIKRQKQVRSLSKIIYLVYPDCAFDSLEYKEILRQKLARFVDENSDLGFCVVYATPQIKPLVRFLGMGQTLSKSLLQRYLWSYPRKLCRQTVQKLDRNSPWEVASRFRKATPRAMLSEPLKYALSAITSTPALNYYQNRQMTDNCFIPNLSSITTGVSAAAHLAQTWGSNLGRGTLHFDGDYPVSNIVSSIFIASKKRRYIDSRRIVTKQYKGGILDLESRHKTGHMLRYLLLERGIEYLTEDDWALIRWLERRDARAIRRGKLVDRRDCIEPECKQLLFDFMTD